MSEADPELAIVIPNLNDADSLLPFLSEIISTFEERPDYSYEIIVVDDGSTDDSLDRLREFADGYRQIQVVKLTRNFGQQTALYVGLTLSKGSIVVTIDGDGQYPSEVIPRLADAIREGYDMASANRVNRSDDLFSKITSKIGALLIRKALNMSITDFGSVKAFSRALVDRIIAVQVGPPDVYPAALSRHPRLKELDIAHRERTHGKSKWSLTRRVKLYFDLYIKYSDDQFGIVFRAGLLMIAMSVIGTLALFAYKAIFGHQESVLMIIALGAIFLTMGYQLILWSFFASAIKQIMRRGIFKHSELVSEVYCGSTTESVTTREPVAARAEHA